MPLSNNVTSATITLYKIDEVSLYSAEIISSNGNIFHPYDLNTTLLFKIFQNSKDITSEFVDIAWTRISFDKNVVLEDKSWGEKYKGLNTIDINKNDFQEKCVIQADAYTVLDGKRTCVASARITLVDVNELYTDSLPPENPIDGQIWVDTSGNTPMIYSWNDSLKRWVTVGKTTPTVRNLIQNSNFWTLNSDYYLIENDSCLMNPIVHTAFNKTWLRLKSVIKTDNESTTAGIMQTTSFPIVKNSDYTFSLLAYCVNDIEYTGKNIYVEILSVSSSNEIVELSVNSYPVSNTEYSQINCTFRTLNDTENIRIIIGVNPMEMCELYITELSLYNTDSFYPWELSPEDFQVQLENKLDNDHKSVFNALTKNGTMEGIYVDIDENGEEHYYFNGSHIQAGSIDGGLINAIGLNVKDEVTGKSIFHVYKDENGTHIDMIANNLYIGTEEATTQTYVDQIAKALEEGSISYTDTSVATSAEQVTQTATTYTDEQIRDALEQNKDHTDNSINSTKNELIDLISTKTADAETNSKNYTDTQITSLSNSIVSKVRNSEEYKDDLDKKVNISDYNTHVTSSDTKFKDINDKLIEQEKEIYSKAFLSDSAIDFTVGNSDSVTLDNILDAINITTQNTDLTVDVSKLNNTNFISMSEDNSKAYLNLHEMVKLLLYKVKQLESKSQ